MKTKFNGILTLLLAFVVQLSFAQEKTISGTVVDETNMPLPGATVLIKGTTTGTSTDFDGKYSISAKVGDVLTFSYVGYTDQNITIGASNKIEVALELDAFLDEIVIEAYSGVTSKAKTTSAITTINAEKLEDRPSASIVQTLEGQVAGLNIGTSIGQPGANSLVLVRGLTSLNGNVEPLFVIDGVPVDEDNFRSINQNDIENVSVLKDAAATALYGNRGAAGAIIMTTKRGKFSDGLKIAYSGQSGFVRAPKATYDAMSATQYLNLQKTIGSGQAVGYTDGQIAAIAKQTNINWQDLILRTGYSQNHNLSISAGTDKTNSYTSLGIFEQEGVFRNSDLTRFSFRNNFNGKTANDRFNFGSSISANYSVTNDLAGQDSGSTNLTPLFVAWAGNPTDNPYNPDGSIDIVGDGTDGFTNRSAVYFDNLKYNVSKTEEIKIIGSVSGDYKLTKNLSAGVRTGIDYTQQNYLQIIDPNSLSAQNIVEGGTAEYQGFQSESFSRDARFSTLGSINYNKTFNDVHSFDFAIYTEYNYSVANSFSYQQSGINPLQVGYGAGFIPGDTTEDLNDSDSIDTPAEYQLYIPTIGSNKVEVANWSYFGVLKYDYKSKYGFQGSLRRDASSRFTGDNKWGTFYALSGFWNIHKENFMSNSKINNLKLRASYGTTGNERIGGGYYDDYRSVYNLVGTGSGYNNSVSRVPTQIGNPDLKWETTAQANIGLDFGYNNNRFSGSVDFYNKTTTDLFLNTPQSTITLTTSLPANVGELVNKGVELNLRYNIFNGNDFKFSIFANGSYNDAEIKKLDGTNAIVGGNFTTNEIGYAPNSFRLVKSAGVNPANGAPLYYDINGNITETYNESDRVTIDKSALPKYQGGFGFNSSYKGFTLDTQFTFAADYWKYNQTASIADDPFAISLDLNADTRILTESWLEPGDVTQLPGYAYISDNFRNLSDKYLQDSSYLRLKNITLGYNFDKYIDKMWGITGLKIYGQVENLVTFTKYRGFANEPDLTVTDFFNYPSSPQIFSFGVDVKF